MRLIICFRMVPALLTASVLCIHGTPSAAENPAGVPLQSIETPVISIGSKLKLTLCAPENRVSEAPTWQLALAGIRIPRVPCGVAVAGSCVVKNGELVVDSSATAPETIGTALQLTYDLAYDKDHRIAWMQIFDQRNDAEKVDVALFTSDGKHVRFASPAGTLPVASKVVVRKYPRRWWIPVLIVGGLIFWLFALRKTNTLRDSTLCVHRYFLAQMENFREARREECAIRRVLIAEAMTKKVSNATTRLNELLTEKDEKKQEALSQALAVELQTNGIENPDKKLSEVYRRHSENKRWAKQLQAEMEAAGVRPAPDPLNHADDFEDRIHAPEIRDRLPPYSLGRLQMAWWFLIVTGGVALMYVSTGTLFKIPESVLWLIGVSVTTAGIGYAIDNRQSPKKLPPVSKSCLKDVLTDTHGGDTFYRWQMLVTTLLLGLVFVIELVRNFVMTDFDMTMLGLMGISAGTYLGFKWPERSPSTPAVPAQQSEEAEK